MSKQKQVKQIKIELNEPKAIHPAVLKAYRDAGAMHLFTGDDSPTARNEAVVFSASKVSKKNIHQIVTAIYRRKLNNKEYCFMHNAISCVDYFGNHVSSFRTLGRYSLPVINKVMGISPGMIKGNSNIEGLMEASEKEVSIDHMEDIYEYEFEQVREQLEEFYKRGIISDELTKFYVWTDKKYTKPFSFREFMDHEIQDLVLLSRFSDKLSTAFRTDEITQPMLDALRKTLKEELLTVKVGAS